MKQKAAKAEAAKNAAPAKKDDDDIASQITAEPGTLAYQL